jgi:monoamine oxidase
MIAAATERLVRAFGSGFRRRIVAAGATDWGRDPLIGGSFAHARPGRAHRRRQATLAETGPVVFAGEAFSPRWPGTAHGAYQSGRDRARALAERLRAAGA